MSRSKGRHGRPWERKRAYIRRQAGPCGICGKPIDYTLAYPHPQSFTVDHIEPLSLRPDLARDLDNLQAAHNACNRAKGTGATPATQPASRDW